MANSRHLPAGAEGSLTPALKLRTNNTGPKERYVLENTDHPWFSLVIDQIINFVIAVDQRASILRLCVWVPEKRDHVVKMWNLSYRDLCL